MTAIERTAYPRFKRNLTAKDLDEVYTPPPRNALWRLGPPEAVPLRLAFWCRSKRISAWGASSPSVKFPFPSASISPSSLIPTSMSQTWTGTIAAARGNGTSPSSGPHNSSSRMVLPRTCLLKAMFGAARTKEDLADLINVALEELAKECLELPPFATLDKAAHHVRAMTTRGLYHRISQAIRRRQEPL
jgi:hypothetical protein